MKKILVALCYIGLIISLVGCKGTLSDNKMVGNLNSNIVTNENKNDSNKKENDTLEHNKEEVNIKEKNCRIYYFDASKLELIYVNKELEIIDNALCTALTKEMQTGNKNDSLLLLPKEVNVKDARLDREKGILTINLSQDYTELMSLGTATESGMLTALINTYGYNYGVGKVAIEFNGELYTGLKGELPEGYWTIEEVVATELQG